MENLNLVSSNFVSLESTIEFLASKIETVICRNGKNYPFVGEKGVRAHLSSSQELKVANAFLMYFLQTESEQAKRSTEDKNRRGLMSSHAKTCSAVITALQNGIPEEELEIELRADGFEFSDVSAYLTHIGGRYAKQLSVVLRDHAISKEPELAACAALFSVK
jgi:hypothetical protein